MLGSRLLFYFFAIVSTVCFSMIQASPYIFFITTSLLLYLHTYKKET